MLRNVKYTMQQNFQPFSHSFQPQVRKITCRNKDTSEVQYQNQQRQSLDLQFKTNHVGVHERPQASRIELEKKVHIPFERFSLTPRKTCNPYQNGSRLSSQSTVNPLFFLEKQELSRATKSHSSASPPTDYVKNPSDLHANIYNNFSTQTRNSVKRNHFDMTTRLM